MSESVPTGNLERIMRETRNIDVVIVAERSAAEQGS